MWITTILLYARNLDTQRYWRVTAFSWLQAWERYLKAEKQNLSSVYIWWIPKSMLLWAQCALTQGQMSTLWYSLMLHLQSWEERGSENGANQKTYGTTLGVHLFVKNTIALYTHDSCFTLMCRMTMDVPNSAPWQLNLSRESLGMSYRVLKCFLCIGFWGLHIGVAFWFSFVMDSTMLVYLSLGGIVGTYEL